MSSRRTTTDNGTVKRLAVALALVLVAASSVSTLAVGSPALARDLSLTAAWYGVSGLALIWALLELIQWLGRDTKVASRLARAGSLLGILTLGQGLTVAGTQMVATLLADGQPSLAMSLAALASFLALATGAVALGPVLLRRLTRIDHPDDPS